MLKKIKKNKGLKGFIIRSLIFLGLYLTISLSYDAFKELLGQESIGVNDGYLSFMVYFLIAIFIYARRKQIAKLKAYKNTIWETVLFLVIAIGFFLLPYQEISEALDLHSTINYFLFYGLGQFSLFLAVFNLNFFLKEFMEEILIMILVLIVGATSPIIIELYWGYFFIPIKYGVTTALALLSDEVTLNTAGSGFTVRLGNFSGSVGATCSGLFSMSTFALLFAASVYLLKKKGKISKIKTAIAFFSGIITLYILNIVRIIIIMYVGAYYSQKLAIDLFHEYLSSIFVMAIFLFYLYKIIPRLTVKEKVNRSLLRKH